MWGSLNALFAEVEDAMRLTGYKANDPIVMASRN